MRSARACSIGCKPRALPQRERVGESQGVRIELLPLDSMVVALRFAVWAILDV